MLSLPGALLTGQHRVLYSYTYQGVTAYVIDEVTVTLGLKH